MRSFTRFYCLRPSGRISGCGWLGFYQINNALILNILFVDKAFIIPYLYPKKSPADFGFERTSLDKIGGLSMPCQSHLQRS